MSDVAKVLRSFITSVTATVFKSDTKSLVNKLAFAATDVISDAFPATVLMFVALATAALMFDSLLTAELILLVLLYYKKKIKYFYIVLVVFILIYLTRFINTIQSNYSLWKTFMDS